MSNLHDTTYHVPVFSEPVEVVPKGWGKEVIHFNTPAYCNKTMYLKPGKRCSWHYHKIKDETFRVLRGEMQLECGLDPDVSKAQVIHLRAGDMVRIPPFLIHRFTGLGGLECIFEEVSTHDDPADSIRLIVGDTL